MPKYIQLTESNIDTLVNAYQAGDSLAGAAKHLGMSNRATAKALEARGLKPRTVSAAARKYAVNEAFFDVVSDESVAYWLGFITADGYVYKDVDKKPAGLKVGLAAVDDTHLIKMRDAFDSEHPIRYDTCTLKGSDKVYDSAVLAFGSKRLADRLCEIGVVPAKSLIVKPHLDFPEELHRHYWRGLVDGDGSLLKYKGRTTWILRLLGSKDVIVAFKAFLNNNGIFPKATIKPHHNVWMVSISGNGLVKRVADLLWGGASVFLDRKHEKYVQLMAEPTYYQDRSTLTKEDLLRLYSEYNTWLAVAEFLGTSSSHLDRLKKKLGIRQKKSPSSLRLSREELVTLRAWHDTWSEVATHLDISLNYMYKLKRLAGL